MAEPGIFWKHIIPLRRDGEVVARTRLVVCTGEPESYYSLITPEAYHACLDWMDFRASYNEEITGESWVMRDLWQTTSTIAKKRGKLGLQHIPNNLRVPVSKV